MNNIVIFDIETTGLDKSKDSIIQFAAIKYDLENNKLIDDLNLYIQPEGSFEISVAAYFKHHISAKFLLDKPFFKDVADQIINFIGDCDIITFNGNGFDIPFLKNELNRVGKDIDFLNRKCWDAFLEEKRRNGNNLESTYKRYKGKTPEEAGLTMHDALSDVKCTLSVWIAQNRIQKYDPEKMFGEDNFISMNIFDGKEQPCFNNGKYKNVSLELVKKFDKHYLEWCISDKSNFQDSTKRYIREFLEEEN